MAGPLKALAVAGRVVLWIFAGLFALAGVGIAAAWILQPAPQAPPPSAQDCRVIAIASNGFHVSFYLPADLLAADGPLRREFPWAQWFIIGWGDEGFYREGADIGNAIDAILPPSPSVIHAIALIDDPRARFTMRPVDLALSETGARQLAARIEAEIETDLEGAPIRLAEGQFPGRSVFFRGRSDYHGFHTCNVWTALRLREAGAPVSAPAAQIPAQTLMGQIETRGRRACPAD